MSDGYSKRKIKIVSLINYKLCVCLYAILYLALKLLDFHFCQNSK